MSEAHPSPFSRGVMLVIVGLYVVAGVILYSQVGPWEAVRYVVINGLIVVGWLVSAHLILGDRTPPEPQPVHYPAFELAAALGILAVVLGLAANRYAGWLPAPRWVLLVVWYGLVAALLLGLRYPARSLGLAWPSRRGWLALLAVVAINIVAMVVFQLLPRGEAVAAPARDLAEGLSGPWSVLILIGGLLVGAALPEELLLRVTLQPRLARFMPLGWAILVQAFLFAAGHLPQKMIGQGLPFMLALGYTLPLDNGLIAGYLWHRERSLPLLVILHLLAFPRFGI